VNERVFFPLPLFLPLKCRISFRWTSFFFFQGFLAALLFFSTHRGTWKNPLVARSDFFSFFLFPLFFSFYSPRQGTPFSLDMFYWTGLPAQRHENLSLLPKTRFAPPFFEFVCPRKTLSFPLFFFFFFLPGNRLMA